MKFLIVLTFLFVPFILLSNEMDSKEKIMEVLNVFETGSKRGDYSKLSYFNDGPNDRKQITYGRSQTTEYGNLRELLRDYIANGGKYAGELQPYVDNIGRGASLYRNKRFTDLLKSAGDDPIMIKTQDDFFERRYWQPAKRFFDKHSFKHPLSMLVLYDSYIHSGGILSFLRKRFSATPDNEIEWITQYVDTRHKWLASHRRPILRKTIYRTKTFQKLIKNNNWSLKDEFTTQGHKWEKELDQTIYPEKLPKLPLEENILDFYEKTSLSWFSFPTTMILQSGRKLSDKVGNKNSDYVCHPDIKENLEDALQEVYDSLGENRFKREGWNIFGGGYNPKGSIPQQLSLKFIFGFNGNKPELSDEGVEIMEKFGFLNMGRATGNDWGTFVAYIPSLKKDSFYKKVGLPFDIS